MSPTPTGSLARLAPDQFDLVLVRTFAAPIDDVWASLTDPDRTAAWFGRWRGEPGTGSTIEAQMAFEEGAPWLTMHIDSCEPPRLLGISATDEYGERMLELTLSEIDGVTQLDFVQHLTETSQVENVGPGWEYYLDMLVVSREGGPAPSFDDYYPAQKEYYERQAAAAGR